MIKTKNILKTLIILLIIFASCSEVKQEESIKAVKVEIDTLYAIGKKIKEYKNGYAIYRYGESGEIKIKLPDSVKKDISKNPDAYRVSLCKNYKMIIKRDYEDAIVNINTKDIYKVNNKYRLNDYEYEKLFNAVMNSYYETDTNNKQCSRDALNIEFFDLNFDGIDEMIITGDFSISFYMHGLPMFIVEKKDGEYKVIYSYVAENFEIHENIRNNYYTISDLNLSERGTKTPVAIVIYYQYNGTKYVEYKKSNERINLDE